MAHGGRLSSALSTYGGRLSCASMPVRRPRRSIELTKCGGFAIRLPVGRAEVGDHRLWWSTSARLDCRADLSPAERASARDLGRPPRGGPSSRRVLGHVVGLGLLLSY